MTSSRTSRPSAASLPQAADNGSGSIRSTVERASCRPAVLVRAQLRDPPLQAAFAGIAGSIESRAATWNWLGGITYRDIVVRDPQGRAVGIVPKLVLDKGLLGLALAPRDLGTVRLVGVEVFVEVRTLKAISPLFRGEESDRIRLPDGDSWRWADELVAEDFAIAVDVASRSLGHVVHAVTSHQTCRRAIRRHPLGSPSRTPLPASAPRQDSAPQDRLREPGALARVA